MHQTPVIVNKQKTERLPSQRPISKGERETDHKLNELQLITQYVRQQNRYGNKKMGGNRKFAETSTFQLGVF